MAEFDIEEYLQLRDNLNEDKRRLENQNPAIKSIATQTELCNCPVFVQSSEIESDLESSSEVITGKTVKDAVNHLQAEKLRGISRKSPNRMPSLDISDEFYAFFPSLNTVISKSCTPSPRSPRERQKCFEKTSDFGHGPIPHTNLSARTENISLDDELSFNFADNFSSSPRSPSKAANSSRVKLLRDLSHTSISDIICGSNSPCPREAQIAREKDAKYREELQQQISERRNRIEAEKKRIIEEDLQDRHDQQQMAAAIPIRTNNNGKHKRSSNPSIVVLTPNKSERKFNEIPSKSSTPKLKKPTRMEISTVEGDKEEISTVISPSTLQVGDHVAKCRNSEEEDRLKSECDFFTIAKITNSKLNKFLNNYSDIERFRKSPRGSE